MDLNGTCTKLKLHTPLLQTKQEIDRKICKNRQKDIQKREIGRYTDKTIDRKICKNRQKDICKEQKNGYGIQTKQQIERYVKIDRTEKQIDKTIDSQKYL